MASHQTCAYEIELGCTWIINSGIKLSVPQSLLILILTYFNSVLGCSVTQKPPVRHYFASKKEYAEKAVDKS